MQQMWHHNSKLGSFFRSPEIQSTSNVWCFGFSAQFIKWKPSTHNIEVFCIHIVRWHPSEWLWDFGLWKQRWKNQMLMTSKQPEVLNIGTNSNNQYNKAKQSALFQQQFCCTDRFNGHSVCVGHSLLQNVRNELENTAVVHTHTHSCADCIYSWEPHAFLSNGEEITMHSMCVRLPWEKTSWTRHFNDLWMQFCPHWLLSAVRLLMLPLLLLPGFFFIHFFHLLFGSALFWNVLTVQFTILPLNSHFLSDYSLSNGYIVAFLTAWNFKCITDPMPSSLIKERKWFACDR